MRVLCDLRLSCPEEGLAAEENFLSAVACGKAPPTLRLWRNRRCVVIGRSQDLQAEADLGLCGALGIPVLRRCSGGGAVYHHPGNVNFSLYLPLLGAWADVRESQARLSGRLADALRARWRLPANHRDGGVFVEGKKVSGSAQLRRRALLHHGTLLIWEDEVDMRLLLRAMHPGYRSGSVRSRTAPVADLSALVGSPVALEEGVGALLSAYGDLCARYPPLGPSPQAAQSEASVALLDTWTGSPLGAT